MRLRTLASVGGHPASTVIETRLAAHTVQILTELRALAVSAVILNHLDKNFLPSGFLGVDIFFVISGYVITSSLSERRGEPFGALLLNFYSRRIKRLTPALLLFVTVTCTLGFIFISPASQGFTASWKTGIAALLGVSNIWLLREATDYFGSIAELNLFTHTWSLGVEEQFYLLFPFVMWASGFFKESASWEKSFVVLMAILCTISFCTFLILSTTNLPAAYFLMPARLWELGIGCMAFLLSKREYDSRFHKISKIALPLLLALLCVPATALSASTLGVVLLTSLLLALPSSTSKLVLSCRLMVTLGVMSYSLYLWHWSIIVVTRLTIGISAVTIPIILGLMVLLAFFSYTYVERPLRTATWSRIRAAQIGYGIVASVSCAAFLGFLGGPLRGSLYSGGEAQLISKGVTSLMDPQSVAGKIVWSADKCVLSSNDQVGQQIRPEDCTFRSANDRKALVIGNSFSAAEIEMYKVLPAKNLASVIVTSTWGASPVPEIPNVTPWSKANDYYWSTVIPMLLKQLQSGDIVIMINDIAGYGAPEPQKPADAKALSLLQSGLSSFAYNLQQRNIGVIFQAANPFMERVWLHA